MLVPLINTLLFAAIVISIVIVCVCDAHQSVIEGECRRVRNMIDGMCACQAF